MTMKTKILLSLLHGVMFFLISTNSMADYQCQYSEGAIKCSNDCNQPLQSNLQVSISSQNDSVQKVNYNINSNAGVSDDEISTLADQSDLSSLLYHNYSLNLNLTDNNQCMSNWVVFYNCLVKTDTGAPKKIPCANILKYKFITG